MTELPDKTSLREHARAVLRDMSADRRHAGSVEACRRLVELEEFRRASTVMLYLPMATEVDTTPIALRCFQTGRTVCVPRVNWERKDMHAVEVTSFDDHVMESTERPVRSPKTGRPVVPDSIDLVVVPGLAFDAEGGRLGRGGGFYDRYLARLPRTARMVGLAFDEQIVDSVPMEPLDVPLHLVVTDRRLTRRGAPAR